MRTEMSEQKVKIPNTVYFIIVFAFIATFITVYLPIKPDEITYCLIISLGISQIMLVAGVLACGFYFLMNYFNIKQTCIRIDEKRAELKQSIDHQTLVNADAEKRRAYDRERDNVNDLFRLIELSKEKHKKSESVLSGEKPDKFLGRVIEESEVVDTEKLKELIEHYKHIFQTQNTDRHV